MKNTMSSDKNEKHADTMVAREDDTIVPASQVQPNFVLVDSKEPGKKPIRYECNYVMVDPDDESVTDSSPRYPRSSTNSKQVSMCGLSPDISSSMVHGIFAVGATSMGKKVPKGRARSRPKPSNVAPYRTDKQVRFCGLDSATSARLVEKLFAAGANAIVDPDRLCRHTSVGTSSRYPPVSPISPNRNKKCIERRVVSIAKDLNHVAPTLVKRENILQVLRESEKKYREKKNTYRRFKQAKSRSSKVEVETISEESETFDFDDNSECPSDIDEFLEFAKVVVEEQNRSFDSDSFRDFESVLQESIRSHFLDEEDADSLDSDSTYSGYYPESNHPKRHLEENMLVSESTRRRIKGTIARKKNTKRGGSIPRAVDSSSCNDAESNDEAASPSTERRQKKSRDVSPNESFDESFTRINISSKSNTSTSGGEQSRTIPSFQESSMSHLYSAKASDSYSEDTVTTGTSWTAIGQQLRKGNTRLLEKYAIDPQDNSLVAVSPEKPPARIRKRRLRKKQVKIITDDESFDDFHNVEETVNSLASLLTDENTSSKHRKAVMTQLRDVAPDLYRAVVAEIERLYLVAFPKVDTLPDEPIASESSTPRSTEHKKTAVEDNSPTKDQTNTKIIFCTPDKVYWADQSHHEDDGAKDSFCVSGADSPPQVDLPCDLSSIAQQDNSVSSIAQQNNSVNTLPMPPGTPTTLEKILEVGSCDSPLKEGSLQKNSSSETHASQAIQTQSESISPVRCAASPTKTRLDPMEEDEPSFLENMIESFFEEKFRNMNILTEEKEAMSAKKQQVINQLKSARASIVPSDSTEAMLQSDNLMNDARTPASPALANRLQRKRRALILARRRRHQTKHEVQDTAQDKYMAGKAEKASLSSSSSSQLQRPVLPAIPSRRQSRSEQHLEDSSSPLSEELRTCGPSQLQGLSEIKNTDHTEGEQHSQFQTNLTLDAPQTTAHQDEDRLKENLMDSRSPTLTATINAIQRVRAKRKKILRGKNSMKALQTTMDNSENDSEGQFQAGSRSVAFRSPRKYSTKHTDRGKFRLSGYEVLPEQETINISSPDMKSQDLFRVFLPPSPESPISGYRLAHNSFGDLGNDVLSSAGNGIDARVLLHDGPKESGTSFEMHRDPFLGDSFDDIVYRSNTTDDAVAEDDVFVNIQKKSSPTSVTDFYNTLGPKKPRDNLGFVDDEEIDPLFLDDDDGFVQRSVGMMPGEEEGLIDINFISTTQFEV